MEFDWGCIWIKFNLETNTNMCLQSLTTIKFHFSEMIVVLVVKRQKKKTRARHTHTEYDELFMHSYNYNLNATPRYLPLSLSVAINNKKNKICPRQSQNMTAVMNKRKITETNKSQATTISRQTK